MCCHPSLTQASQIALTLRALGGLTTAEVARALLVPEDTVTRRISRAKEAIKESGIAFRLPSKPERAERLAVVLHVLYLIFNEGYVSTEGAEPPAARPRRGGDPARADGPPPPARGSRGLRDCSP